MMLSATQLTIYPVATFHFAPSALFIQVRLTQGVALGYYMSRLWR